MENGRGNSAVFLFLFMAETRCDVIIHHAGGLHVGVDRGASEELEPALF